MTAVSGAALTAIFIFPKESDMCRLSAKFRVFASKYIFYGSQDVLRTDIGVQSFCERLYEFPGGNLVDGLPPV